MLDPIAVYRVNDRNILLPRQRHEFSITRIEPRIDQILRHVCIFAIRALGQVNTLNQVRRAMQHDLIKAITDARLAARIEVPSIFVLYRAITVEKHCPSIYQLEKKPHCLCTAVNCRRTCVVRIRTSVCDNGNVGIYDAAAHSAAIRIRLSLASSASAVSVNASPMNRSGQFRMFPYKSTSKGVNFELPLGASQK